MNLTSRIDASGYKVLRITDRRYRAIYVHVMVAEDMIGGELPKGFDVHHIDNDKLNNSAKNLMICSRKNHSLMHRKNNTHYPKCWICKEVKGELVFIKSSRAYYHTDCNNKYKRDKQRQYYWGKRKN